MCCVCVCVCECVDAGSSTVPSRQRRIAAIGSRSIKDVVDGAFGHITIWCVTGKENTRPSGRHPRKRRQGARATESAPRPLPRARHQHNADSARARAGNRRASGRHAPALAPPPTKRGGPTALRPSSRHQQHPHLTGT